MRVHVVDSCQIAVRGRQKRRCIHRLGSNDQYLGYIAS
jgi:hypothetical protein